MQELWKTHEDAQGDPPIFYRSPWRTVSQGTPKQSYIFQPPQNKNIKFNEIAHSSPVQFLLLSHLRGITLNLELKKQTMNNNTSHRDFFPSWPMIALMWVTTCISKTLIVAVVTDATSHRSLVACQVLLGIGWWAIFPSWLISHLVLMCQGWPQGEDAELYTHLSENTS